MEARADLGRAFARRSARTAETTWHPRRNALAVDATMLVGAAFAGTAVATHQRYPLESVNWMAGFAVLCVVLFAVNRLYSRQLRLDIIETWRSVVTLTALATMAIVTLQVLLRDDPFTAGHGVRGWLLSAAFVGVGRTGLVLHERRARRDGARLRRALLIGAGTVAHRTVQRLLDKPELGLLPVGFLDSDPLRMSDGWAALPVLGGSSDIRRVIDEHDIEHVVVTFSSDRDDALVPVVAQCEEMGVAVSIVPRLFDTMTDRMCVDRVGGLPLITLRASDPKGWQVSIKYALDRIVGVVGVVVLAPLFLMIAAAVRIDLGAPVLFRQRRISLEGREFEILKFRTMRDPAPGATMRQPDDDPTEAPGGVGGIDRRTALGRFLRATSLDELPQLVNVARGDMSLVGPRPECSTYVRQFERSVYRYAARHRVKSGMTGLAQINGLRGQTSLPDRIECDNYYIANRSFWLDLKILLLTVPAVLRHRAQ